MKTIALIPARMGSSRFPGKPIAPLLERTMIEHVFRRTAMCPLVDETYVATCDHEIYEAVEAFGGKAIMTDNTHERASDRVAEAAGSVEGDIFVMVQGDEPMITPQMVAQAVKPMHEDPGIMCVNLAKRIANEREFLDPNCIKVVMAKNWDALCFSRQPIPYTGLQGFANIAVFKQVCIIPFTQQGLKLYQELEPTPGEIAESVDMMRFLEHGIPVRMVETDGDSHAVDIPQDLELVESLLSKDPFVAETLAFTLED